LLEVAGSRPYSGPAAFAHHCAPDRRMNGRPAEVS
jgi:hypothetical protein